MSYTDLLKQDQNLLVGGALVLAVVLMAVFASSQATSFLALDSNTSLEYIEDNNLGRFFVQSGSPFPTYYQIPSFRVCVYTTHNRSPVILPVETREGVFILGEQIRHSNLSVSIPEEKLSEPGLNSELPVEKRRRCPLRSTPKIVVTEYSGR